MRTVKLANLMRELGTTSAPRVGNVVAYPFKGKPWRVVRVDETYQEADLEEASS